MTPRQQVERLQRQGRAVLERMNALRLGDDLDETFYEALGGGRWSPDRCRCH